MRHAFRPRLESVFLQNASLGAEPGLGLYLRICGENAFPALWYTKSIPE